MPDFLEFSVGLNFDAVDQIWLVIPFFHIEFDFLKVSLSKNFKIPLDGAFGDFWLLFWLFSRKGLIVIFTATPQKLGLIMVNTLVYGI